MDLNQELNLTNTNTNFIGIAIDADSLIYKACYRHQIPNNGGVDIEKAWLEFCYEIGKIRSAIFRIIPYDKNTEIKPLIILSPKTTFRHKLSSLYKSHRMVGIHGIKQLKIMCMHRMGDWALVAPEIEADDMCIYYAKHHNYLVSAIDKDVIHACPTSCYDYNKREWNQPNMGYQVEAWYVKQALMGDTADCIKGAPDIGEKRAQAWVDKFIGEPYSWSQYVDMFGDESLALQAMNLVRMDRIVYIDGKFVHKPWEPFGDEYWEF